MSYYGRGDYYRGDYYRGDPGILGSIGGFIGKVASTVGGIAKNIPGVGGIVGTGVQLAGGLLTRASGGGAQPGTAVVPFRPPAMPALPSVPGVGVSPLGTIGVSPTLRGVPHLNKSSYWVKPGVFVAKGTRQVKSRHMNVGNARALKRALRRAHGFAHLARSVMSYTITGKHYTKGHFKSGRKRR